jgi:hypothetical protein
MTNIHECTMPFTHIWLIVKRGKRSIRMLSSVFDEKALTSLMLTEHCAVEMGSQDGILPFLHQFSENVFILLSV